MKLEEIKPMRSKFKLSSSNKEYSVRPFTLEDEIWAVNTLGASIDNVFVGGSINYDNFTRILYRIICDKSDFKRVTTMTYDDNGDEVEESIGGYKKFQTMVMNDDDKTSILKAFTEILKKSRPEIGKALESDSKKKG